MKKLFTFAAALLFGLSAMAVEPTWESANWGADDFANVVGEHATEGFTISTDQTAFKGNLSGSYYLISGGGTDFSAANWTNYVMIAAAGHTIDSIAVLWTPNTTNATSLAWCGWEADVTPSKEIGTKYGELAEYTGSKTLDAAIWQTIDLSTQDVATVLLSRQIKKATNGGSTLANIGQKNQTVNFLGFKIWINGAVVATKYTVSYYDGTTLLDTEKVVEGATPANHANYEAKDGYTFDGWFNDAAFTSPASLTAAITADKAFYGKWTKEVVVVSTPSTSVNIEQLILDNSKNYNIQGAFDAAHITYASLDALDSLNASKDANNEPFLGLKLKTAGAYVQVALKSGNVLRLKFGNVAADIKVNGTTVTKDLVHNVATGYEYTATEDVYVKIETTTSGTVVLKQIMINEPIAAVNQPAVTNNTNLATLTLDGVAIAGFSAGKKEYTIEVAAGSAVPVVAATAADEAATVGAISQAASVPGDATFTVTAADGTTTATYTIHFVLPREIEYLTAPYETTIPADFELPAWITGCAVNLAYMGSDTVVCGHDVIRFEKTDTISMYINSCDSVVLDLSATGSRTIAIAVNGVEKANSGKFNSKTLNTLGAFIHSNEPVVVNIYGVEVGGGTTISRIKVTAYDTATGMENVQTQKAVKVIENGQIVIIKNGVRYNALGARL